jgi:hypothetical protein
VLAIAAMPYAEMPWLALWFYRLRIITTAWPLIPGFRRRHCSRGFDPQEIIRGNGAD